MSSIGRQARKSVRSASAGSGREPRFKVREAASARAFFADLDATLEQTDETIRKSSDLAAEIERLLG